MKAELTDQQPGLVTAAMQTRRARFLSEMDRALPWTKWEAMIEAIYPKPGRGRPPYPFRPLLRLLLVRLWFQLSDLGAEELVADSLAVCNFLGIDATKQKPPDETTILNFRRWMQKNDFMAVIMEDIERSLAQQNWKLRPGVLEEPGLLAGRSRIE